MEPQEPFLSVSLLGSMLVDELAGWKAALMRHIDEAEEALHVMMDEHDMARQHVLNMYRQVLA